MQGGLVGQLVKRWSEQVVTIGGLVLLALGLILLSFSTQLAWLLITLAILSIGNGAVTPTFSTLLSFAGQEEKQGETLGFAQGVAGLARIIGPLVAGVLYDKMGAGTPFITGGILVVLAAWLALPALPHPHRVTSDTLAIDTEEIATEVSSEQASTVSKLS